VTALDFNSNGTQVASASRDRTARIYNAASGVLETTYAGHDSFVFGVAFLPSGQVASAGRDKVIDIWDVSDGKRKGQISGFDGEIYKVICSVDRIFTAGADKTIRQYETKDRRLARSFGPLSDVAYALAMDDASGRLAAGGYDGVVRIWNARSGMLERSFVASPGFEARD
jgi:WD40 repeat protein